jgi:hypothetical protein
MAALKPEQNASKSQVHCPSEARWSAAFQGQSAFEAQNPGKTHEGAEILFLSTKRKERRFLSS